MSGSQWSSGNAADQKSRMVAAGFVLIFLLSLIPILAVARYDCASGDDYGFGAAAHQAFVRTGSVAAAVQADVHHVGEVYEIWQGTWLSCFLFGLHPEVFHYHAYVIVPWIMLLVLSAGVLIFVHHFLTVRFGFSGSLSLTAAMILLISMVQLVPDRRFAYFWWNGSIHYTVPFTLALRLFGNIHGEETVVEQLGTLSVVTSGWVPACMEILGVLFGLIQALIF